MNTIAKLKTLPLLAALLTAITLAPTLSMAGTNNERGERAQHSQQRANPQHAQPREQRNDQHPAQRRDQHRDHPVNHYRENRSHQSHGHHPARAVYRDRNHHHGGHGHPHTVVRNSYRQPIYVSDYPRRMIGLHSDNFHIIFRDR